MIQNMYNICFIDSPEDEIVQAFGEKYDLTDDLTQANVVVTTSSEVKEEMLESKLVFAVSDLSDSGTVIPEEFCSEHGIAVFRSEGNISETAANVKNYIENGNIVSSVNLPDVDAGGFGNDVSRISIIMKGIDDPILLSAMMFSGLDLRLVAGGLKGEYGAALVSSREPITRVPHVEGVLKVRVLQDI